MTRSEEQLRVGTETQVAGKARLRKHVVTEHQRVSVPVSHEEVTLEREPITDANRGAAYDGSAISEEEHEVTLHAEKLGLRVVTVDLSTAGKPSSASVHPREVARHHPEGERAVFVNDRGRAVTAMALAFEHFVRTRSDLGGIVSAGGSFSMLSGGS